MGSEYIFYSFSPIKKVNFQVFISINSPDFWELIMPAFVQKVPNKAWWKVESYSRLLFYIKHFIRSVYIPTTSSPVIWSWLRFISEETNTGTYTTVCGGLLQVKLSYKNLYMYLPRTVPINIYLSNTLYQFFFSIVFHTSKSSILLRRKAQ